MIYEVIFKDGGRAYLDKETFERTTQRGVYYPLLSFLDKSLSRKWVEIRKLD